MYLYCLRCESRKTTATTLKCGIKQFAGKYANLTSNAMQEDISSQKLVIFYPDTGIFYII